MLRLLCSCLHKETTSYSVHNSIVEIPPKTVEEAPSLVISSPDDLHRLDQDLAHASHVFVDVQGDICCRIGQVSIITLGIETRSSIIAYTFDFKAFQEDQDTHSFQSLVLKKFQVIMASSSFVKIIHRSCEVSDILFYQYNINLTNVIDTSYCIQNIEKSSTLIPLEAAYTKYCLENQKSRGKFTYINWDRRPITYDMLTKSTDSLTELYNLYLHLKSNELKYKMYLRSMSTEFETFANEYRQYPYYAFVEVPYFDRALFQSKRCNWLKLCEEEFNVKLIYMSDIPKSLERETIFILAYEESSLDLVKEKINLRISSFHSMS